MIYVIEARIYADKFEEAMKFRQMMGTPPPGAKFLGQYFLLGTRRAIHIIESESLDSATLMQRVMPLSTIADVTVSPAISAEEGMKVLDKIMQQRQ